MRGRGYSSPCIFMRHRYAPARRRLLKPAGAILGASDGRFMQDAASELRKNPSTHSTEYQALGVEESKLNSMPILGMPARDIGG